jgi:hypothetical protein
MEQGVDELLKFRKQASNLFGLNHKVSAMRKFDRSETSLLVTSALLV